MGLDRDLKVAIVLSILITIALLYATVEVPRLVDNYLITVQMSSSRNEPTEFLNPYKVIDLLRPVAYFSFALVTVLIVIGLLLKSKSLAMAGSLAFYLPTFGYYAVSMVWIAGIGIIRALWLPLLDVNPLLLKLGHIVLIPYIALSPVLAYITNCITESPFFHGLPIGAQELLSSPAGLIALASMAIGIFFFTFGTATWLYGRFKGVEFIDFWAYRFCRHPQYLGFLLWSYGMTLSPLWLWPPRGITLPTPTTPWLITALIVIAIALWEEAKMVKEHGEVYMKYREKTPFMIPLPKGIAKLIVKPVTVVIGKPYPETPREVVLVIGLYGTILSIASIPIALMLR